MSTALTSIRIPLLGILFSTAILLGRVANAQQAGTVWLDFVPDNAPGGYPDTATLGQQIDFAGSLRALNGLDTLTDAQVLQVETNVTNIVRNDFGAASIAITSNAVDPSQAPPDAPSGDYTLVVIGDALDANRTVLGQANQIDWRNLSFDDKIGVSTAAFNPSSIFANTPYTVDTISQRIANTVAHEIGHTLGLVHADAAATYLATPGTDAQKKTAVQNNDLMRANVTSFASGISTTTAFNSFSQLKLGVAAHGILLENQAGQTGQSHPNTADPIDATADTNTSFSTALPLVGGSDGLVNVIGNIGPDNNAATDYFKFAGQAGQAVNFEVYSTDLEQVEGDTDSGRIAPGGSIGANTLTLLSSGNGILETSIYPSTDDASHSNYDGALDSNGDPKPNTYGDALFYGYTPPSDGTYYLELQGSRSGEYELLAVPEPASLLLLALGALVLAAGRFRQLRAA